MMLMISLPVSMRKNYSAASHIIVRVIPYHEFIIISHVLLPYSPCLEVMWRRLDATANLSPARAKNVLGNYTVTHAASFARCSSSLHYRSVTCPVLTHPGKKP